MRGKHNPTGILFYLTPSIEILVTCFHRRRRFSWNDTRSCAAIATDCATTKTIISNSVLLVPLHLNQSIQSTCRILFWEFVTMEEVSWLHHCWRFRCDCCCGDWRSQYRTVPYRSFIPLQWSLQLINQMHDLSSLIKPIWIRSKNCQRTLWWEFLGQTVIWWTLQSKSLRELC